MFLPIYRSAVRQFDSRVRAIRAEQWALSTPDTEWDVRELVRHVTQGQARVPLVLAAAAGAAVAAGSASSAGDSGPAAGHGPLDGTETGPELVERWAAASAAAVAALTGLNSLDVQIQQSDGPETVADYGWRMATELTVHAWDLARAIGAPDELPNDLLAHVLEQSKRSAGRWLSPDSYAASIPVPGCTDDLTELLALTGRNRWWRRDPASRVLTVET